MLSFNDALDQLLAAATPVSEIESVPTEQALGRVLAHALVSALDLPPLDNSAMDGYAVRASDVAKAGSRLPISQRIAAGSVPKALEPGTAARIFTGAPVPSGADSVVMQEECAAEGETVVIHSAPVRAGQHIRRAGEDIRRGTQILAAGTRLRAQELGLAASIGSAEVPVYRRLRVATFYTGSELVMPGTALEPGQIYNSNRFTLAGMLAALGCEIVDLGIVRDDLTATQAALAQAARDVDLVLTSGGVSVGEEDHVRAAVEANGTLSLWRIAVKPGKPLAYGEVHGTPFIGLPGNPVSVFATFSLLVRPYLLRRQGMLQVAPRAYRIAADFEWPHAGNRREFVRARLSPDAASATIFANQSSGVLTSAVWADGLIDIPEGSAIKRGDTVRYLPFTSFYSC